MHLDPHHFQQADRFYQSLLNFHFSAMNRDNWGFSDLAVDVEALRNGQFKLKTCRGIMPDGLAFDLADDGEALPASITIDNKTFPPEKRKLGVYLIVPEESERDSNFQMPGAETGRETRFDVGKIKSRDATTGDNPIDLFVGSAQLRIYPGDRPPDGYTALKIAEVVNEGALVLNRQFIPPCVTLQASSHLSTMIADLLEKLINKRNALWEQRRNPAQPGPMTLADAFIWGRLNVMNTFIPWIRHSREVENCHPQKLYALLLALAGQLTTYAVNVEVHPAELPAYNHFELGSCFNEVRQSIELLLQDEIKQRIFRIDLEKQDRPQFAFYQGQLDDELLRTAQFYLVVSSDRFEIPERLETLSGQFKIASKKDIVDIVKIKLPGLGVKSVSPSFVGKRDDQTGLRCLQIIKSGELWDKVVAERDLVIWVGGDLKEFKIELIAVKER
jgi:type VI secretion system protein ImpJ